MVNEGPMEICKQFLEQPQYEEEQITKLGETLQEFIKICDAALDMNKDLIASNQIDFHQALCDGLYKLVVQMNEYVPISMLISMD